MHISELEYSYPDQLVALKPRRPSRVMWVDCAQGSNKQSQNGIDQSQPKPKEIKWQDFLNQFTPNDLIVMNDTKVLPSLIVTPDQTEVHMIQKLNDEGTKWEVLFPARDYKINDKFALTKDHEVTLVRKGLPQVIEFKTPWTEKDFFTYGKPALPPYILKLRQELADRQFEQAQQQDEKQDRYQKEDDNWYQSAWAEKLGSVAAPTASLHFGTKDIEYLKSKNVQIEYLTLHVGMGTFLPVKTEDLHQHIMHKEFVSIPKKTIQKIEQVKKQGGKVWALGTTVTRSLEAYAQDHFQLQEQDNQLHGNQLKDSQSQKANTGAYVGQTDLLIQPPYQFQIVDNLLTNFHQPKTTLLALVAAYAGADKMKAAYQWAIENEFQLFSYGDLSVWTK